MRITGGSARGIQLKTPKGTLTRPATDRLRESIFSSLGPSMQGCRVADLFAGTGSYGLEALSRGASCACFYESDRQALACLRQNLQAVLRSSGLSSDAGQVVAHDVYNLKGSDAPYDLIFLDPPYDSIAANLSRIFEQAVNPMASGTARAILELPSNLQPELPGWQLLRRLGKSGKNKPTAAIFLRISAKK